MNTGFCFIEIKTTGLNPILDKIYYLNISSYTSDMIPKKSFEIYLNTDRKMTKFQERESGYTTREFWQMDTFKDHSDTIYKIIGSNTLCTFDAYVDVVEFLKEALFDSGIDFSYKKKDLINLKNLEENLYPRYRDSLYYKYAGKSVNQNFLMGNILSTILKAQCEILGVEPKKLNISKLTKTNYIETMEKYLYEVDGVLYLNFGKSKDIDVKKLRKDYVQWILDNDFPAGVKEKIREYTK